MTRLNVLFLTALLAVSLFPSNSVLASESNVTANDSEELMPSAEDKPSFGLAAGMLWAYSPATTTGFPMRFGLGVPLLISAGPLGIALELGGSSSLTSFDLSPYALAAATGPVGPVRLGGSVLYSYTPPWSGNGTDSHLVGANGTLVIPIVHKYLALGLSMGPRHPIGTDSVFLGGGVLFFITPG